MFIRSIRVPMLLLCLTIPALAQDGRGAALAEAKSVRQGATAKAVASTANWEIYRNLTIAPGQFVTIDSGIDFTGSDRVAVSYVNQNGVDLTGLGVEASWAVSGSDFFASTDRDNGGNFAFTNSGGSLFQVFGTSLRMILVNNGNSTVTIQQVMIYSRSR